MVFLKNFYFDLFVTSPSLFMLLRSRLCCDYFPIPRDPSRSSLTPRDASRFLSLLSPYASLFFYYPSYAGYDYLISPFHSRCYLSLAPYVSLSSLALCSFLRSHRRNKRKTNTFGATNGTTNDLLAPPTKDYRDRDPWQETGVRLLPLEPRGSKMWS